MPGKRLNRGRGSVFPKMERFEGVYVGAGRYETKRKDSIMLSWALLFLILAIVAGIFGFGGVAAISAEIAQVLFVLFLVLFIVSAIVHVIKGRSPPI